MKIIIPILAVAIGISLYFFYDSKDEVVVSLKEEVQRDTFPLEVNEEGKPKAPVVQNPSDKIKLDTNEEDPTTEDVVLSEEEMDELENYYERIEDEWGEALKNLLKNELQLSDKVLEEYEKLREGFEEEKLVAFQEHHEQMVAKHGENYSYRPNEDEKIFEKRVLDEYQERIRKLLGDDAYQRYTEFRDLFNERIKAEQDPAKGLLIIDM